MHDNPEAVARRKKKALIKKRETRELLRAHRALPDGGKHKQYPKGLAPMGITQEMDTELRAASLALGVPVAELVREAIADFLGLPSTTNKEN